MNKKETIETLQKISKEVNTATEVKTGFAVVNSRLEFLSEDGEWVTSPLKAKITFERVANKKAEEIGARVTRISVIAN